MLGVPATAITVFGNSEWSGLPTYLGRMTDQGAYLVAVTSGAAGQWAAEIEGPGTYTAAIEDAYGFGPVVRPGLRMGEQDFTRVNVEVPFAYDLLNTGAPAQDQYREYAQLFKAPGTSVVGVAFKNAEGILISMYECLNVAKPGREPTYDANSLGHQVGPTVAASAFYPHGLLPTVPGKTYCLKFARKDGEPFRMGLADNEYPDSQAYLDGERRPDADLAIRIQYDPSGQILRHKPGFSRVYKSAKHSYGQTFLAKGTSLAMLDVFVAHGDAAYLEPTVRIRRDGPEGRQLGPEINSHVAVFNPGELPLIPGRKYYIEVSGGPMPTDLRMYAEEDVFASGQMYLDGQPVPERDLAMILVEYEPDTAPPPPPTIVQVCPFHGGLKVAWDVPLSNDITKVLLRRLPLGQEKENVPGALVAEMPVTSQGRSWCVDTGLENGVTYLYRAYSVDAAGNESIPGEGTGTPCARMPLTVEVVNGDFEGQHDFLVPYGWMAKPLHGGFPRLRIDSAGDGARAGNSVGWNTKGVTDFSLCQRVPCRKGRRYQFSAETWRRDPWRNDNFNIGTLVGIDPAGGDDPLAKSVVWSQPFYKSDEWVTQSVTGVARSDQVTIYLRAYGQYCPPGGMDARFDNAMIRDITATQ